MPQSPYENKLSFPLHAAYVSVQVQPVYWQPEDLTKAIGAVTTNIPK